MADQELIFYCRSRSTPNITHQVSVEFTEEELFLSCDCAAGERSITCHHITRLIENDPSVLSEPTRADQLQDLALLQSWLQDTTCRDDFHRLHQLEQAVKDHKKFKAQIADALQSGRGKAMLLGQQQFLTLLQSIAQRLGLTEEQLQRQIKTMDLVGL